MKEFKLFDLSLVFGLLCHMSYLIFDMIAGNKYLMDLPWVLAIDKNNSFESFLSRHFNLE